MDMIEKYDVDSFRFFVLSEMTKALGQDASFTEEACSFEDIMQI